MLKVRIILSETANLIPLTIYNVIKNMIIKYPYLTCDYGKFHYDKCSDIS